MVRAVNTFPIQKLPFSKKTEQWYKDCIDFIIGESSMSNSASLPSKEEMQANYDLYNSIYNEKDLKYVTNPFNVEDGFPAKAQDYNIIRPKIDLLIGEKTKRPFNFRVCRTSDIASSELQDQAKQMLMDYVQAYVMSAMGPEEQARFQQALETGEVMTPEQIQTYLTKDYKDIAEITAYHTLNYLRQKLNLDHEFMKGWKDAIIAGITIFYVGVVNGEPYVEVVNPLDFWYAAAEGVEFIHDADRCCRKMEMSAAQLYDKFYDKISEKELNDLLELIEGKPSAGGFGPDKSKLDNWNPIRTRIYSSLPNGNPYANLDNITIYHACWRSYKLIYFITMLDPETGMPEEFQVDEFYKPTGLELNIEKKWIVEIHEGYRAGDDWYIGMGPVEYQYINSDLNSQRLPYTGVAYSNTNSPGKSLVSIMKPLQYFYITLWYRLEIALARDKGKALNMDITQIPKSMGIDVSKWLHYLSAMGVNLINPYEEGWDIPGREGGKPASFNQITAVDMSMANTINQYIELMNKIEDMISEISGITRQREGAISSNELVGNVERSVIQSAHITEPLFWMQTQVEKHVLIMLLNTAKAVWGKEDRHYLHYILDEGTRAFLELSEDFPYEDFDIFVNDSTKENNTIEQVRALAQVVLQNGGSVVDIIDMYTIDNVSMLRNKLVEIENERIEQEQAMREQELEAQKEIQQMQAEVDMEKILLDQAKLDMEKYKIDIDAQTRITVAEINAYRGKAELDQDGNGIPDPIEIANTAIARQRLDAEVADKQLGAQLKAREIENKRKVEETKAKAQEKAEKIKASIENKKIALEEKKLKEAKNLQKMKDKAALEREKLKAKTALKNKVVGEE